MSLPPIITHSSPSFSRMGRNMGVHLRNYVFDTLQHPNQFKRNAVIASSLLLVASRILISWGTAMNAITKRSKGAEYRKTEFATTLLREVSGFTLSFLVVRLLEFGLKVGLEKSLGIQPQTKLRFAQTLKNCWQELKTWLGKGQQSLAEVQKAVPKGTLTDAITFNPETWLFQKIDPALKTLFSLSEHIKTPTQRVQALYNGAPLLLSSVVAVVFSGILLERWSRSHAKAVATKLSDFFRFGPSTRHSEAQKPEVASKPLASTAMPFVSHSTPISTASWPGQFSVLNVPNNPYGQVTNPYMQTTGGHFVYSPAMQGQNA